MSTKARARKTPAPATLLVPGLAAEQRQRSQPPAIDSQAIGHAVDQLPARRNLAGFDGLPLTHLHAGGAGRIFNRPAPLEPSVAEKSTEQTAPCLAAEVGEAAAGKRMLDDSHILITPCKASRQERVAWIYLQAKYGAREAYNQRAATSEYYQTLLALLNDAIASGDLSGGSAFDKTTLLNLEQQAQSFASLPTATAGARAMDDTFNYPLSLLLARLRAISAEAGNFTTTSGRLLDILANETRSLPGRANKMPARAGEDWSLCSSSDQRINGSSDQQEFIGASGHQVTSLARWFRTIYIVGPVLLVTQTYDFRPNGAMLLPVEVFRSSVTSAVRNCPSPGQGQGTMDRLQGSLGRKKRW
jgi:hypothetical protein